ncbi:hypothetical protein [Limosilactobacillus fastidiosus]|uniref:Uncharacterized protein n=1 Tax=Limosilactobacillus fastidiosus TaxID=2759855 RepID=A0A7W3TZU9_9LACO|nr:hypothetical protein [Limosilactobacillus fastidiosus]MBB1086336.1 hypothetical protein [Limosilactobacillus fastidiosus]MCD7086441.1 hypothetical protein [Limosilactobacillus fastidiosus]MCD7114203.1 hypothetical protein [Limosilactobacillus fastidiosus]MCD7116110.1 hypothetical protein [Limosilactobacillus fastidiosus]
MNKVFMTGYYQGVVEVAPASLSAAKVEELAITMTIQHLRHAGMKVSMIHDFLVLDIQANERLVNRHINDDADQLETVQAKLLSSAFTKRGYIK